MAVNDAPPAIFLMGPTASGKSDLALRLAQRLNAEIVSVDSALVYREMDIGTAKPDTAMRAQAPHHLIDIRWPHQAYSAAQFAADAAQCMAQIRARGRIPLLVGGTMLYFKALREGLSALPQADAGVRAELDAEAAQAGWPAMHAKLAALDAASAARLQPTDAQRIQRALEVHRLTGQPMSALLERRAPGVTSNIVAVALEPSDRAALHARIAVRLERMFAAGLIDEVTHLRSRFALDASMPSMRAVGYRQVWQYLDGACDRRQLSERAIAATRQLAKRQLTWLRGMTDVQRVDCLAPDLGEQVFDHLSRMLG